MAEVGLSTTPPPHPRDADFAIFVDFDKGAERPQRIFGAIEGLIAAFERLDKTLVASVDTAIEPVLVLEDIEAGSLKVWLRDKLRQVDDDALKQLDWRPAVGKYLVAAKYAFVRWVSDEDERKTPGSLADLRKEFLRLAQETDVRRFPAYGVPSASELLTSAEEIGNSLTKLNENDKAAFISDEGTVDFDLRQRWDSLGLTDLAVKETIEGPPSPMILAVKRPDYLGDAQWEFRHGKRTIRAKIKDKEWLDQFQERKVDVRPGDALRCEVAQTVKYGYDNELVAEIFTITKVNGVLENEYRQSDFFED